MELLGILIVIGLAIALQVSGSTRCVGQIERWAAANHFELASVKRRWFGWGSGFMFGRSRAQRLFDIVVRDEAGHERVGVAKVGGWFMGAFTEQVDVRWQ